MARREAHRHGKPAALKNFLQSLNAILPGSGARAGRRRKEGLSGMARFRGTGLAAACGGIVAAPVRSPQPWAETPPTLSKGDRIAADTPGGHRAVPARRPRGGRSFRRTEAVTAQTLVPVGEWGGPGAGNRCAGAEAPAVHGRLSAAAGDAARAPYRSSWPSPAGRRRCGGSWLSPRRDSHGPRGGGGNPSPAGRLTCRGRGGRGRAGSPAPPPRPAPACAGG